MKNLALLAAALLLLTTLARGTARDYRPYALHELVARATTVVAGQITALDQDNFELTVERWIVGTGETKQTVGRFRDWTCASRWAQYEVGQRVLILASNAPGHGEPLAIMGGGCEGELLILGEDVFSTRFAVHGYDSEDVALLVGNQRRVLSGYRITLDEFAKAVAGFRKVFQWTTLENTYELDYSHRDGVEETTRFTGSSPTAQHLGEEVFTTGSWKRAPMPDSVLRLDSLPFLDASSFAMAGMARVHPDAPTPAFGRIDNTGWGSALAIIGDLDGDGISEYAVGAPSDARQGPMDGTVWIVFPNTKGMPIKCVELPSESAGGSNAPLHGSQFGHSLVGIGDINGDGIPDLAVAAPQASVADQASGAVYIITLTKTGGVLESNEIVQSPAMAALMVDLGGDLKRARLGTEIANIGDLDGDGFAELLLVDAGWSPLRRGSNFRGAIVSLGPKLRDGYVRSIQTTTSAQTGPMDKSCCTYVGIGDVDGDGVPDLAVGDSSGDDGGESRGAVWICFMARDGSVLGEQCISDWQGDFDGPLINESRFGESLAAPGDMDGDGVPDLIVHSQGRVWLLHLADTGKVKDSRVILDAGAKEQLGPMAVKGRLLLLGRFEDDRMHVLDFSKL